MAELRALGTVVALERDERREDILIESVRREPDGEPVFVVALSLKASSPAARVAVLGAPLTVTLSIATPSTGTPFSVDTGGEGGSRAPSSPRSLVEVS